MTVSDPHCVINQGHGNATGRAIQIGILTEIVANNRRGGWRRPGRG